MNKIKESAIAGSFYPAEKENLEKLIEFFKAQSKNYYADRKARAVIVPHAGLVFSGRVAYEGIEQLDKNIENIFIIAPAHKVAFEGLALTSYTHWETPLGKVKINRSICKDLVKNHNAQIKDDAFEPEHSAEIEVPIIQTLFEKAKIIPVLVGKEDPEAIEKILEEYYPDKKNGFVISSDLSHFLTDDKAKNLDNLTAQMIETGNVNGFRYEQACGAVGVVGLVMYANKNKYSLIRIDMTNSSSTTGDKSRVVGYGSWFMFEDSKSKYLEKYCSQFMIDMVKIVINSAFERNKNITINYPQIFDEYGACFVTLEKEDRLRGCIGSIIAHQPLVNDLVNNAKNAAFKDFRFKPVSQDEVKDLKVAISILTHPVKIEFKSEKDLLKKISAKKDGIIIKDGNHQAVYLPSVWEQLPEKSEFLNSLKVKAGLSEDYFSENFEAYKFAATYIKEK
jgi:AmmeMemoRadiSam system protein B/AmmeMemoRadiSam system protein A